MNVNTVAGTGFTHWNLPDKLYLLRVTSQKIFRDVFSHETIKNGINCPIVVVTFLISECER